MWKDSDFSEIDICFHSSYTEMEAIYLVLENNSGDYERNISLSQYRNVYVSLD